MKKLSVVKANAIVGGHCAKTCTITYALEDKVCNEITTCVDKHGKVVSTTSEPTSLANCGAVKP